MQGSGQAASRALAAATGGLEGSATATSCEGAALRAPRWGST